MIARYFARLRRSQSLRALAHKRAANVLILLFSIDAIAEQPNYGKIAIDEVIKNIIELPQKAASQELNEVTKSAGKEIFKNQGNGKIETKNGKIKIDTTDRESLEKAAEFRRNYIKSEKCKEPKNESTRIECANEYIKARELAINQ